MRVNDIEIINLFFRRDETAIAALKQKYGRRIYKTAHNIVKDEADAEECVNDALLKTWNIIPPERPTMLGAFVAKITRNLALNIYKAKRVQKRGGAEMDLILGELQDTIPDAFDLEATLDSDAIIKAINSYLFTLDREVRIAFVLRYFHGEPITEISKYLNLSESDIKSKLFRVRKKLALHLEEEGISI